MVTQYRVQVQVQRVLAFSAESESKSKWRRRWRWQVIVLHSVPRTTLGLTYSTLQPGTSYHPSTPALNGRHTSGACTASPGTTQAEPPGTAPLLSHTTYVQLSCTRGSHGIMARGNAFVSFPLTTLPPRCDFSLFLSSRSALRGSDSDSAPSRAPLTQSAHHARLVRYHGEPLRWVRQDPVVNRSTDHPVISIAAIPGPPVPG
mgnify:CR=1 FL=1